VESDDVGTVAPQILEGRLLNAVCHVEEVTSVAQFMALRDVWRQVLDKSQQHTPFLTYEWFQCCLTGYLGHKDLFVLVIRDGSEVLGIAPWWRYHDVVRGIPVHRLGFIMGPDTPEVDFISQQGQRAIVLETVLNHCFSLRKDAWDMLTLSQWPIESPHYSVLEQILQQKHQAFCKGIVSKTLYLPIQKEWEAYLQTRSLKFRKTYRNIMNRINKLNNVEIQCIRQNVTGDIWQDVLSVSKKSWKFQAEIAIASQSEAERFFEVLTDMASQQGWLFVWLLKVDTFPIAMEYDLAYAGRVYALRADFDESYKELSPGSFLEYHIIKYLFEKGYCEYNLGPGLNAYKFHWTDHIRDNTFFSIYNITAKGIIMSLLERRLIPLLRHLRDIKENIIKVKFELWGGS
jgi:CelD/BcsL family acetyltransferase involved in cellulose biosynthesis